jgi:DNA-directed RNA polymerase subunit RPC12/RpoP
VVLASLVLWVSFAWCLPAEPPATEGDADAAAAEDTWRCANCNAVNDAFANYCTECGAEKGGEAGAAAEDPWAGVRISDAYDDLRCPYCWEYNELTAARCPSCGHEFPQPSAEVTDPDMVFVPGKGYYREGTLLEPGKSRKGLWITGLVLTTGGALFLIPGGIVASVEGYYGVGIVIGVAGIAATAVGIVLLIRGIKKTKPVYAFEQGGRYRPFESETFARRSRDSEGEGLRVEVTLLSF